MSNLEKIFVAFQHDLEEEQEVREALRRIVRDLDSGSRQIHKLLQIIHTTAEKSAIGENIVICRGILENTVKPSYSKLNEILIPVGSFHQFHDLWWNPTQRLAFLVALIEFLENGGCASYDAVAQTLNMSSEKGLKLELEDYLIGLLTLASELSRLAVNSVTLGDYDRPLQISKFVGELAAGFRLLSFKNDHLRKKYDGLKYDVKKIEEVVYDLSIRGLTSERPAKAKE